MIKQVGAVIREVLPDSIALELELEPGDILLRINGQDINDFICFLAMTSEEKLTIEVLKKSGEIEEIDFEKDPDEPLGLSFDGQIYDRIKTCKNQCLFCFVSQLPSGQRKSLYVKDDDYRLSFLQGCYITLTNLSNVEWERIIELHLSPLYISVHATQPEIRCRLLGSKNAGHILAELERLISAGIQIHTQAVLCPGLNDGPVLEKTISDLADLYPGVLTLAIVPVGLTAHRQKLYPLQGYTKEQARSVLEMIHTAQDLLLQKLETRFVFAADEWYIKADMPIPKEEVYEGYPQLDNGIGLISWFTSEFDRFFKESLQTFAQIHLDIVVIVGKSAASMWKGIAKRFTDEAPGINLTVLPVTNNFFGDSVTVTGLLVGRDIAAAICRSTEDRKIFLVPQVTLKRDETVFLDNMTVEALKEACFPKQIEIVPTRASEWLEWIIQKGCENC